MAPMKCLILAVILFLWGCSDPCAEFDREFQQNNLIPKSNQAAQVVFSINRNTFLAPLTDAIPQMSITGWSADPGCKDCISIGFILGNHEGRLRLRISRSFTESGVILSGEFEQVVGGPQTTSIIPQQPVFLAEVRVAGGPLMKLQPQLGIEVRAQHVVLTHIYPTLVGRSPEVVHSEAAAAIFVSPGIASAVVNRALTSRPGDASRLIVRQVSNSQDTTQLLLREQRPNQCQVRELSIVVFESDQALYLKEPSGDPELDRIILDTLVTLQPEYLLGLPTLDFVPSASGWTGTESDDQEHVFGALSQAANRCFSRALKEDASVAGSITIQWSVTPDGRANAVQIVRSTTDSALSGCLIEAVELTAFAPGDQTTFLSRTFEFRPRE